MNFWKAIEISAKFTNLGENAEARVNLRDSILKTNVDYVENFKIKRDTQPLISEDLSYMLDRFNID